MDLSGSFTATFEVMQWNEYVPPPVGPVVNLNQMTYYNTIQSAVDVANTGDIIFVSNGVYTESVTITGKGLTIVGQSEAGVIVQSGNTAPGSSNVFTIGAAGEYITLKYMTIQNGLYGIRSSAGNVNVLYCTFVHNGWDGTGVDTDPTQAEMAALWASSATSNGGAIRIQNSGSSEIAYCNVYENARGIRLQDSDNGDIHDCVSHDNLESGIYLASSTYNGGAGCTNTVVENCISYNNMNNGLLSIGGKTNTFYNNNVYDNWNSGVMLWHVGENVIEGNTIDNNNLYAFNGVGNPGDAYGGVCALGNIVAAGSTFVCKIIDNTINNNQVGQLTQKVGINIEDNVASNGILIDGNDLDNHDVEVWIQSQAATTTVNYNNFDVAGTGVQNDDTSATLDAENNYWGAADGPGPVGPGSGCGVSTFVDYTPWSTVAN